MDDIQSEIILDCQNLAKECSDYLKKISRFAYPDEDVFVMENFIQFSYGQKLFELYEFLERFSGKTHSLKGFVGFIIPEGKDLCHHLEEIIKSLVAKEIIFSTSIIRLIQLYLDQILDLLDNAENGENNAFYIESWEVGIQYILEESHSLIKTNQKKFKKYVDSRVFDDGKLRIQKESKRISVVKDGYESLLKKVIELRDLLKDGRKKQPKNIDGLINEYYSLHSEIKKSEFDFSRYERLVPNLARKYHVEANLNAVNHGVTAEIEFWSSIHEIINHVVKNAVIHGVEKSKERIKAGKPQAGTVEIILKDDHSNIYLSIRDDGRGIDVEKLREKAMSSNLKLNKDLKKVSEEELLNLVFLQGVTTRDQADDDAGRGVGMAAVKIVFEELNGKCKISSVPGKGSSWDFGFPKVMASLPSYIN